MALAERTPGFGQERGCRLRRFRDPRLRFVQARTLGGEVAFHFDAFTGAVLTGVAGQKALCAKCLEIGLALPGNRQGCLQLLDRLTQRDRFGLTARQFGGEPGAFGIDFGPLSVQAHTILRGVHAQRDPGQHRQAARLKRLDQGLGTPLFGQRRRQLLLHTGAIGCRMGGVELDQQLPGPHEVTILDQHPADDAGLERLQRLAVVVDDDSAGATATISICPNIAQSSASRNRQQTAIAARRGAG